MISTLEKKAEKANWKQWLPVYGIFKAYKDSNEDKPSIMTTSNDLVFFGNAVSQAISVVSAGHGLYYLAERLL